ncbi:MAG TPA: hypothetical protein VHE55_08725 [Fimbriimonadaceae bacterium]|nr:hypothetical protein [Fimbriimonadaceae bacterium]
MQVDVGHFGAEVFNPDGLVGSDSGDATFKEYHEYRSAFGVVAGGGGGFHIGD